LKGGPEVKALRPLLLIAGIVWLGQCDNANAQTAGAPVVRISTPAKVSSLDDATARRLFNGLYDVLPELAGRPAQPVAAKLYVETNGDVTICGLAIFGVQPYGFLPSESIYDSRDSAYFVLQVSKRAGAPNYSTANASREVYNRAGCFRPNAITLNR